MANKDVAFTPGTSTTSPETVSMLREFWSKTMEEIKDLMQNDFKTQELPLARIKKIMKLDEDVKMISAEAPVLFAKAAEIFISELSLRAWIHTEDNKRRTLQRNDIAMAISKFDQFDFLIDIVPREELKPAKRSDECVQRTSMMPDQVQYYFQLAQQAQAALQQQGPTTATATATATTVTPAPAPTTTVTVPATQPAQAQGIQIQAGQVLQQVGQQFQLQIQDQAQGGQPQIIQVQLPQQQAQPAQPQQVQQQAAQQTTQVLHQIVTPSGDIQNIPIQLTADQLAAIQLQVQGKQPGQPIIIQTAGSPSEQIQIQQNQQPMFQIQQVGGQQVFIQQAEEVTQEAE